MPVLLCAETDRRVKRNDGKRPENDGFLFLLGDVEVEAEEPTWEDVVLTQGYIDDLLSRRVWTRKRETAA